MQRKKYSKATVEKVKNLRAQGLSVGKIAKELKIPASTAYVFTREQGYRTINQKKAEVRKAMATTANVSGWFEQRVNELVDKRLKELLA